MVPLSSLVLPVLLATILVFVASSLVWTVLKWHDSDWKRVDREDTIMNGIRTAGLTAGQYTFPGAASRQPKTWTEEDSRKVNEGPMGMLVVYPPGPPQMAKALGLWFILILVISYAVAYIASRTLAPGTEYLQVFRVTGATSMLAYGAALPINAIFFGHTWSSTLRHIADAILYGLLTAGAFGWLWPGM
jgi:hypothetical protein